MKRSEINPLPEYFDRYINQVSDVELSKAFDESLKQLDKFEQRNLEKFGDKRYAEGKWTMKEYFQHLIDWERILLYRALLFARREGSVPQSIDQDKLATNMNAGKRTLAELVKELKAVRFATKAMFESFDDDALQAKGKNWEHEISVTAIAFTIIGHQIHHLKIIEEKILTSGEL